MTKDIISPTDTSEGHKKLPFWIDFGPLLIFFAAFHYLKRDYPEDALIWAAGVFSFLTINALSL